MIVLPEPLARLDAQYEYLISQVEARAMTVQDAAAALAAYTVTDASGSVWGMDLDGDFTRAAPGTAAQKADPSLFAVAAVQPAWSDPTQTPPQAATAPASPWGNPYESGIKPASNPWDTPAQTATPAWAHAGPGEPVAGEPKPDRLAGVKQLVRKNKVFAIVLLVGVAIVAFALLRPSGAVQEATPEPSGGGFPTAEPTGQPTPEPSVDPTPQPTPEPTQAPDTGKGPGEAAVEEVASAYASGDVLQAAAYTMNPNNFNALTRAVIVTTGVGRSGNFISPQKVSFDKKSKTWQQAWVVKGEDGVLFTATVQWQNTDSGWRITAPPVWRTP